METTSQLRRDAQKGFSQPSSFQLPKFMAGKVREPNATNGLHKGLADFMANNNICSYTSHAKIGLINSHAAGQQLIAAGVSKELFPCHLQLYLIGQTH